METLTIFRQYLLAFGMMAADPHSGCAVEERAFAVHCLQQGLVPDDWLARIEDYVRTRQQRGRRRTERREGCCCKQSGQGPCALTREPGEEGDYARLL